MKYTTISGDTWDLIAWKVCGNEYYADRIMEANKEYLDYMIFPANVVLVIPDEKEMIRSGIPSDGFDWMEALNGK